MGDWSSFEDDKKIHDTWLKYLSESEEISKEVQLNEALGTIKKFGQGLKHGAKAALGLPTDEEDKIPSTGLAGYQPKKQDSEEDSKTVPVVEPKPVIKPKPKPTAVDVEDELRPQAHPDAWTGPGPVDPVDLVVSYDDTPQATTGAKQEADIKYSLPNKFQYKLPDRSKFVYAELEKFYGRQYQNKSLRKDLIELVRILGPHAATLETTKIAESNRPARLLKMIAKNSGGSKEGAMKSLGALKAAQKNDAIQRLSKAMLSYKGRPGHKVGGDLESFIGDLMLSARAVDISGRAVSRAAASTPRKKVPLRVLKTQRSQPQKLARAAERLMKNRFKTIAGIK